MFRLKYLNCVWCWVVHHLWCDCRHTWSIWRERITRRKKHWPRMQQHIVERRQRQRLVVADIFTASCVTSFVHVLTRSLHTFVAQNTTRSVTYWLRCGSLQLCITVLLTSTKMKSLNVPKGCRAVCISYKKVQRKRVMNEFLEKRL